ncbi:ATPase family associated with various cellular activities (AAA) [Popillia japonica]|uniref:ATPase family associated with various cellular activities (AAA) n=1 Tax=Popillia japonica TaxID=7064 RepID=A0AAW1KR65_POPJA
MQTEFDILTRQEIVNYLGSCLNYINEILLEENSENESYIIAISFLKQQLLNNISLMEKLISKTIVKRAELGQNIDPPTENIKQDSEYIKLRSTVQSTQIIPRTKGLCDIAGLDNIKDMLRTFFISPVKQPQLYKHIKCCNCLLLFGPPGTGKTKLVDAIAAETGATFLSVTASSILSKYIGQSEKMLRSLFQFINDNDRQTILFIDEIDGLCRQRIEDESDHSRRLKTEFMCQISTFEDCKKGYLVCATNCPWELDTAFIRRFHKRLYIPLPNKQERYNLLKLCTENTSLENTQECWEPILRDTAGYSASDIVQLVQHALTMPIIQLQQNKVWKFCDNYYEALSSLDSFDGTYTVHFAEFNNLPSNSRHLYEVRFGTPLINGLNDANLPSEIVERLQDEDGIEDNILDDKLFR